MKGKCNRCRADVDSRQHVLLCGKPRSTEPCDSEREVKGQTFKCNRRIRRTHSQHSYSQDVGTAVIEVRWEE